MAAVAVPCGALTALALVVGSVAPGLSTGALVLAFSPAELAAPALARALGGRTETAAALMTGTVVLSIALLLAFFGVTAAGTAVNTALFALVIGAAVAGSVPTLRDALLPLIRAASWTALGILVVAAIVRSAPALRLDALVAAVAFLVVGTAAGALVRTLFGGDLRAIASGGGTRDFAVAATVAVDVAGDDAAVLPLAYGAVLFGLFAVIALARRARA